MSVEYTLKKPIKIKELKNKGFKVEKTYNEDYPYFIERDSKAVAVTKVFNLENSEDEDELFVGKMKGHFSTLGITVIRDICLIFNDMFYTDDDEENAMYIAMDNGIPELTITDDVMKERLETIGLKMDEDGNIVENVES